MTIDLLHNKIVKETVTEAFEISVKDNLIPKLYALYGTSLEGIQMYDDYIKDEFIKDGYWYYPLTVIIGNVNAVLWIKWDVSDSKQFYDGIPYAFVGEQLDFLIADDVPIAFKKALEGRSNYFEGGYVKVNVTTDAPSATILAGRYSQTFIDEMTRQISDALSKACGVDGLKESSIEIDIVFAHNTYMEHTSENVTYRRLLISAKGCAPRDFWIKWTRLNSSVAYSVNDNVSGDDIVFELGEDVPHKTREKEYRFLVYGNSDKYRVAMGRKNITEWRELIKRAVKRGELTKTTTSLETENHAAEVSDKLSEILEKCGVSIPSAAVAENPEARTESDAANEALRLAVLAESNTAEGEESSQTQGTEESTDEAYAFRPLAQDNGDDDGEFSFDSVPALSDFNAGNAEYTDEEPALTMEDILKDFIPHSDDGEEEEIEQPIERIDMSMVDESESVHFDLSENGTALENPEEKYEPSAADTVSESELSESETEAVLPEGEAEPELEIEIAEIPVTEADEDESYSEDADGGSEESEENACKTDVCDSERIALIEGQLADALALAESEKLERENKEQALSEAEASIADAERRLSEALASKEAAENALLAMREAKDGAEYQLNAERLANADLRARIEKQKFAIEEVKKLVDEESGVRKLAEAETERLRAEYEVLKSENIRLVEAARVAEEACARAEDKCKEHEKNLLLQIELAEKERTREKNLFAEAARQAKEEGERYLAERAEAEAQRAAEEKRIEALRSAEEARLRREADLRAEKERIEAEVARRMTESEERRKSLEERAKEARLRMEENARRNAEAKAKSSPEYAASQAFPDKEEENTDFYPYEPLANEEESAVNTEPEAAESVQMLEPMINYTYTSKLVRLMFRNVMDPNITARLHEMISSALTQFGKEKLYIKVKASTPDNQTAVLNFVKFPEEELQLLIDIINYLGNSDLGIYKIILE